jgi:hypothetical protein
MKLNLSYKRPWLSSRELKELRQVAEGVPTAQFRFLDDHLAIGRGRGIQLLQHPVHDLDLIILRIDNVPHQRLHDADHVVFIGQVVTFGHEWQQGLGHVDGVLFFAGETTTRATSSLSEASIGGLCE